MIIKRNNGNIQAIQGSADDHEFYGIKRYNGYADGEFTEFGQGYREVYAIWFPQKR